MAPFDGVIANLFTHQGNPASASEAFCTVIDPQSLEADFTVLENELPLIHVGDQVAVSPFATPDLLTQGRVVEINPLVEESGMVRVKASVAAEKRLFEGMNVRVSVQRSLGKQLVVPKSAVVGFFHLQIVEEAASKVTTAYNFGEQQWTCAGYTGKVTWSHVSDAVLSACGLSSDEFESLYTLTLNGAHAEQYNVTTSPVSGTPVTTPRLGQVVKVTETVGGVTTSVLKWTLTAIGTADTPAEPMSGLILPFVMRQSSLPNNTPAAVPTINARDQHA